METNTEAPNRYAELTPAQQQAVDALVNHLASGELYDEAGHAIYCKRCPDLAAAAAATADITKTITIDELAGQLGLSVNAVHSLRHRGNGPQAIRIGRKLRFLPEDIAAWLELNREPAHPTPANYNVNCTTRTGKHLSKDFGTLPEAQAHFDEMSDMTFIKSVTLAPATGHGQ